MTIGTNEKWNKDFGQDGLLYFAQKIQESLYHYTNHIHKYSIMNTQLLVFEYINTLRMVNEGSLKSDYLDYIVEEFIESYSNDYIIKGKVPKDKSEEIIRRLKSTSSFEKEQMMRYMSYYLNDYNTWCIDYVKSIVKEEKEKKEDRVFSQKSTCWLNRNGV